MGEKAIEATGKTRVENGRGIGHHGVPLVLCAHQRHVELCGRVALALALLLLDGGIDVLVARLGTVVLRFWCWRDEGGVLVASVVRGIVALVAGSHRLVGVREGLVAGIGAVGNLEFQDMGGGYRGIFFLVSGWLAVLDQARLVDGRAGPRGCRGFGGIEEVEDVDGREGSLLIVSQRIDGRRRRRGTRRSIDNGDGARVCIGSIFYVGLAGYEGLRGLLGAVFLLVLGLLLLAVKLALVLLVLGDARLRRHVSSERRGWRGRGGEGGRRGHTVWAR